MIASLIGPPPCGPNTLTPYPFQLDAIEAARRELSSRTRRSTLLILPTGCGKTITFAIAARSCVDRGGRVLILAHRKELIQQAANAMDRAGLHPAIELADSYARSEFDPNVVVAGVQTISGRKRLATWPRDYFRLIVIDECVTGDTIIITDKGEVPIRSALATDCHSVLSYNGSAVVWRDITAFMPKGERPIMEITLGSGRSIRCTANHPIYTATGWKRADEIRTEDRVLCLADAGVGRCSAASAASAWHGGSVTTAPRLGVDSRSTPKAIHGPMWNSPPSGSGTTTVGPRSIATEIIPCSTSLSTHAGACSPSSNLMRQTSCVTNYETVVAIRDAGIEQVYDISVDDTHCFFGNGMLVHNCHHSTATTYQRILSHFKTAKLMGLTATPDRADDNNIADVYESIAYEMTIWEAMTAEAPGPYLCPLTVVKCKTQIDLRGIRTTGTKVKDFSPDELEDVIKPLVETLANAIATKTEGRRTIVFTPDCGSASAMATALKSLGVRAEHVFGDSPDRDEKIKQYQNGDISTIVNAMLLTEGFDAPATSAIVPLRPTQSRSLYCQMVGRGTRPDNGKHDCLLVDFGWLTDEHDLVRPADIFDRTDRPDDEARVLAEMIAEADGPVDLVAASRRAETEASRRRVIAIKAKAREVKMGFVTYDAASMAGVIGVPARGVLADARHVPATERQIHAMTKFGIANANGTSRRFASKMLDVLINRANKGLATAKQVTHLIRAGVEPADARAMTIREASAYLDVAWGKRA